MKRITATFALTAALMGLAAPVSVVHAAEVAGVKLEDAVKLGGRDLVLSGAGVRVKMIFKVYAMGLYLGEKKTSAADVFAAEGPKRFKIVMLRDLSGSEVGSSFVSALEKNLDSAEKSRFAGHIQKFNDMFKAIPEVKSGDVIVGDWVPGTGAVLTINGKQAMETVNDAAFYNALLRIWVGAKPADDDLKASLLGNKAR